jgi:heme-degrading monooxygenase HmoA
MYSLVNEFTVTAGRADEFEAAAKALFDLLAQTPGWQGGVLLNNAGYPARFTLGSNWDERATSRAFTRSQPFKDLIREHPLDGIALPSRPAEAYELIDQIAEPGQAGASMAVRWTIDQGKTAAFEESRRALFAARKQFGRGVVRSALYRFLGDPRRYIVYHSALERADLQAFFASPEAAAWQQQYGQEQYTSTPTEIDLFEVVLARVPVTA